MYIWVRLIKFLQGFPPKTKPNTMQNMASGAQLRQSTDPGSGPHAALHGGLPGPGDSHQQAALGAVQQLFSPVHQSD